MAKRKRLVRLFFNTFYEDVARDITNSLQREFDNVEVKRSRVLPEFYYVEIRAGSGDLEELAKRVEELVRRVGGDRVFGVKAYWVET